MYLEERVEQLEAIAVDQGKQIEVVATGLATLTTQMQKGFSEIHRDFTLLNKRVDNLEDRMDRVEVRLDRLESKIDHLDHKMDQRFDELVTLIKSK